MKELFPDAKVMNALSSIKTFKNKKIISWKKLTPQDKCMDGDAYFSNWEMKYFFLTEGEPKRIGMSLSNLISSNKDLFDTYYVVRPIFKRKIG